MKGLDGEERGQKRGTGETAVGKEPLHHGRAKDESTPVSGLVLFRRIILGIIESVGEGAELVSASVDEALTRFLRQAERKLVLLVLLLGGGGLVTAGGLLFTRRLIGDWPLALFLFGVAFLAAGLVLSRRWLERGETK